MTSTAKNYAGQNLRGRSFKGQDLSGEDFSDADLRGADFTDAILIGTKFARATTGVQKRWSELLSFISLTIASLAGFLATFVGAFCVILFSPISVKNFTFTPAIATFLEVTH